MRTNTRWRVLLLAVALGVTAALSAQSSDPGPAAVLITLDGARTQEMFGGFDVDVARTLLKKDQQIEDQPLYRRYWADSSEERRAKLMPFFWGTLMRNAGSVAGNVALGSEVHPANRLWFSYPGYAEMLLGRPHDDTIKSNDPLRNPYPTVLEFLKQKKSLRTEQAAVFASWEVINAVAEHVEGSIAINAGYEAFESPDSEVRRLSGLQVETPTPWDNVRHDAYTFRFAMDYMARHRPRVVYLALGETDDWAHDGRYDRVLETYARTDQYLRELWTWIESQPDYRGRTSLLLTTDHGRGRTAADWRDHGRDVDGAGDTWMAFVSPRMTQRGEWRNAPPLSTGQVASTLLQWMDVDWRRFDPAAAPPVR